MYRDAYLNKKNGCIHLWTWDENGERIEKKIPYNPYFYINDSNGRDGISLFGSKLRKCSFSNQYERYMEAEKWPSDIFQNIKAEQQFLIDTFREQNSKPDFAKHPLKIFFLDIEVYSPDTFPEAKEANFPINLITVYDSLSDMYVTFGLEKPYTPKKENHRYIQCESEYKLLNKFLTFWEKDPPDVVSGWNSNGFDIPYIINRIRNIMSTEDSERLSPVRKLFEKINQDNNKAHMASKSSMIDRLAEAKWVIYGVSCIDYMGAYIWGSRVERESYNLNYIAEVELGEGKLNVNATSLSKLADTDWESFVDYNIQDVVLLKKLDGKLKLLKIIRTIAYKGLARLEVGMSKVPIITGVTAIQALKHGMMIPTFRKEQQEKYAGGFVKEIEPGLKEAVITLDANSLYPNTLISLNLSLETKIGKATDTEDGKVSLKVYNPPRQGILEKDKFREWLEAKKFSLSGAGVIYSQNKKGIIPELVDDIYTERVVNQKQMKIHEKALIHCKDGTEKFIEHTKAYEQLDIMQYTLKILLNSIYGVFANRHSPFYDIDHASSITLTGQAVIKAASNIVDEYAKNKYGIEHSISHYNDTDSVHCSLLPILNKEKKSLLNEKNEISTYVYNLSNEVNRHLNSEINIWAEKELNSKDNRFVFKREAICPVGIYESKKHYILHIKDKGSVDPVPCDTIKYVGVEVAKSTMSKEVKLLIKKVVETIIYTKDVNKTNDMYKLANQEFRKLPIEALSFRCSISKYSEYERKAQGFKTAKRTPIHCKASIHYNRLLEVYNIKTKYDNIKDAMKVKYFYCKPNKYNFSVFGFVDKFPVEINEITIDYDKMFEKLITPAVERLYECVKWRRLDLKNEFACDIFELFKEDPVENS